MILLVVCVVAAVFGFVGSVPLAGPVALMTVSRAAQKKFGEARRIGVGAAMAEGLYAGAAFFAYTSLLGKRSSVVPVSRGITAVVLLLMGVHFVFWKRKKGKDERENKGGTVLLGFTVSAVNPTLLLTWSTAVALLYSKGMHGTPPLYAIPFGASAAAGVVGWFLTLVAILRKYEDRVPERALTWLVRAMGLVLVGLALWSGVDLLRALHAA
jgi:threonine/homoserine/homoserine lactone efflux protein